MKKINITLLLLLICMAIQAQNHEKRAIPRPQAPGIEFEITQRKAKKQAKRTAKKTTVTQKAKKAKRVPAIPLDGILPSNTPYDTLLLSKFTKNINGEFHSSYDYTYDEYGYYKLVTYNSKEQDAESIMRYTYTVGADNYWTSRLIEAKNNNEENFTFESKEEREYDTFNRLKVRKIFNFDNESNIIYLQHEQHYDYEHPYYGEEYGFLVKDINYNSNGSIASSEEYEWFPPAKEYILKNLFLASGKIESTFFSDSIVYKAYNLADSTGLYTLDSEKIQYYGKKEGTFQKLYNNGEISLIRGKYIITEENTPNDGYTTYTSYTYDDYLQSWEPTEQTIVSGMIKDADGEWQPQFNVNYYYYYYYYSGSLWNDATEIIGEWFPNNILKIEEKGLFGRTYYEKYDSDGNYITTLNSYDKKTNIYSLATDTIIDGRNSSKLVYYDTDGKELKTILAIGVNEGNALERNIFYLQEGDKLTPLSEEFELGYIVVSTKEGYPQTIKFYTEEKLSGAYKYEYNDKGYKKFGYNYETTETDSLIEILSDYSEYILLDDSTYRVTSFEYYDGEVSYAYQKDLTIDDISIYYFYDAETKQFIEDYRACEPIVTFSADGTITTIEREIDENCKAVNSSKEEWLENDTCQILTYYYWDKENSVWEGSRKEYWSRIKFQHPYKKPASPENMYNDEHNTSNDNFIENNEEYYSSMTYNWFNGEWYPYDGTLYQTEMIDNKYTLTCTNINWFGSEEWYYSIEGNPNGYISQEIEEYHDDGYNIGGVYSNTTNIKTTAYKYNEQNMLIEHSFVDEKSFYNIFGDKEIISTESFTNTYEYANVTIYPTDIKKINATQTNVKIDGLNILSLNGATITLYDIKGRKISESSEKVVAPHAGNYIVKCNGETTKISVK